MLKPIRNRVLVRPDPVATQTESGFVIPDSAKDHAVMSGEVVALGPECKGPKYRVRAEVLADVEHAIDRVVGRMPSSAVWHEELLAELRALLSDYYDQSQDVQIGAQVCFPYTAGTDIVAEERLLLVREEDIAATWHADDAAVDARL